MIPDCVDIFFITVFVVLVAVVRGVFSRLPELTHFANKVFADHNSKTSIDVT